MWGGRRRETQGDPSASAPKIFSSGEGAVDLTVLEELSLPCQLSLPPVQVSSYRLLFGSRVRKSEPLCLFPLSDSMFGTNFLPVTCVWSLHWSVHKKESNRMSPTASACFFAWDQLLAGVQTALSKDDNWAKLNFLQNKSRCLLISPDSCCSRKGRLDPWESAKAASSRKLPLLANGSPPTSLCHWMPFQIEFSN